jgi:L-asparagine transporter-like permease
MLGPWTIPQNDKKKKKKETTKPFVNFQELVGLTIINPDTNFIEMVALLSKNSSVVA